MDETKRERGQVQMYKPSIKKKNKKIKFDWLRPRSRRERGVLSTFKKTKRKRDQHAFGRFYEGLIVVLHA